MERMFEESVPRGWWRRLRPDWPARRLFESRFPRVDVIDRDSEVLLRADLPGVQKKELDVSVNETSVTIRGKALAIREADQGHYYRSELSHGSFARTIPLPAEIESGTVKASFRDGLLELVMHKAEKARRRNVKID
jgi:HSP20 family protein